MPHQEVQEHRRFQAQRKELRPSQVEDEMQVVRNKLEKLVQRLRQWAAQGLRQERVRPSVGRHAHNQSGDGREEKHVGLGTEKKIRRNMFVLECSGMCVQREPESRQQRSCVTVTRSARAQ